METVITVSIRSNFLLHFLFLYVLHYFPSCEQIVKPIHLMN